MSQPPASLRRSRALRLRAWGLGILVASRLLTGWWAQPPRAPDVFTIDAQRAPAWQLTLVPGIGHARAQGWVARRRVRPLRGPGDLIGTAGLGVRSCARIAATREVRIAWADP